MINNPSVKSIMDSIIPITRFNRGEANKIFEEVKENGVKIVLKNNIAIGVLVDPQRYEAMVEMLEDYALFLDAEERVMQSANKELISHEDILASLGISGDEVLPIDVEFE